MLSESGNFVLSVMMTGLLCGCAKENGCYTESGKLETTELILPPFQGIQHEVTADFILRKGTEQNVTVTGDKNMIRQLKKGSFVQDGLLNLQFENCVQNYSPLLIDITVPSLISFTNDGNGNFQSAAPLNTGNLMTVIINGTGDLNLHFEGTDDLVVQLNGTGNIVLTGTAKNEEVILTGNGTVDCFGVTTQRCTVSLTGNSSCMVNVTDSLMVDINGNGIVYYKGYPVITESITGSGLIIDAN